jgi:hypothetical protein
VQNMNVLVLGVDHEIQRVDAWRSAAMKAAYKALLTSKIQENGIQFDGEEAPPGGQTVAHSLTAELALPRPWRNIDMPEQARKDACIYEAQMQRVPVHQPGAVQTHFDAAGFYLDLKNGSHLFCPRVPSDAVREDYMIARALEGAGEASRIMILCGNFHVKGLAERFGIHGDNVTTDAVYNYGWYDPG